MFVTYCHMLQKLAPVTNNRKKNARRSQSLFEKFSGVANARGRKKRGALIRITFSQLSLSALHKPETNGRRNNKLIPQRIGEDKNRRNWPRTCLWEREIITNKIRLIESIPRDRNKL